MCPRTWGAQVVGALLASGTVWLAFGHHARDKAALAATFPVAGTSDGRAWHDESLIYPTGFY
jgi:hypothetical protein